jgi:hypothetical protein
MCQCGGFHIPRVWRDNGNLSIGVDRFLDGGVFSRTVNIHQERKSAGIDRGTPLGNAGKVFLELFLHLLVPSILIGQIIPRLVRGGSGIGQDHLPGLILGTNLNDVLSDSQERSENC